MEAQKQETPDRDEWDDPARWETIRGIEDVFSGSQRIHVAHLAWLAYRLGRLRGHIQGDGLGRRKGFQTLFNLLVGVRDKAIEQQEAALKAHAYANAKMVGRTRYALETALGMVQQMFVAAEAVTSMREQAENDKTP